MKDLFEMTTQIPTLIHTLKDWLAMAHPNPCTPATAAVAAILMSTAAASQACMPPRLIPEEEGEGGEVGCERRA